MQSTQVEFENGVMMIEKTEYTPAEMADLRQKWIDIIGDREWNELESFLLEGNNVGKIMWKVDSTLERNWVEKGGLREASGVNSIDEDEMRDTLKGAQVFGQQWVEDILSD